MRVLGQTAAWFLSITLTNLLFGSLLLADETPLLIRTSMPVAATMPVAEPPPDPVKPGSQASALIDRGKLKGWDYVFSKMVAQGVDAQALAAIFADPRMPRRETLFFGIAPREPKALYRRHNSARARQNALKFYKTHYRFFNEAALEYKVPESVILAILQVETQCGGFIGNSRIFHRLVRLASAQAPENLEAVSSSRKLKNSSRELLAQRAAWLENEFLPHAMAAIELAENMSLEPLEVRGSAAGAVGIAQFLPANIKRFGSDGDSNGRIDLFSPADSIHSVARFLSLNGWKEGPLSRKEKEQVLWNYNHSRPYVQAVLGLAAALEPDIKRLKPELERFLRTAPKMPILLYVR